MHEAKVDGLLLERRETLQNSVEVELSGNKFASRSVPHMFNIVPNMFPFFTTLIFYTSSFLEQVRARGGVPNVLFQIVPNMFPTFTSFVEHQTLNLFLSDKVRSFWQCRL